MATEDKKGRRGREKKKRRRRRRRRNKEEDEEEESEKLTGRHLGAKEEQWQFAMPWEDRTDSQESSLSKTVALVQWSSTGPAWESSLHTKHRVKQRQYQHSTTTARRCYSYTTEFSNERAKKSSSCEQLTEFEVIGRSVKAHARKILTLLHVHLRPAFWPDRRLPFAALCPKLFKC